jgi:hypothetical protein
VLSRLQKQTYTREKTGTGSRPVVKEADHGREPILGDVFQGSPWNMTGPKLASTVRMRSVMKSSLIQSAVTPADQDKAAARHPHES